jgi:hypothetical protein
MAWQLVRGGILPQSWRFFKKSSYSRFRKDDQEIEMVPEPARLAQDSV